MGASGNEFDIPRCKSQAYPGATVTCFLTFLFFGAAFAMLVAGSQTCLWDYWLQTKGALESFCNQKLSNLSP